MKNQRKQHGFTLIELMIVIGVIAVLAAIAFTQYRGYVARAQVSRVIAEAASQRVMIEECYANGISSIPGDQCVDTQTHSDLLAGPMKYNEGVDLNNGSGFSERDNSTRNIIATASITARFGSHANSALRGSSIVWARDTNGNWRCYAFSVEPYNPPSCPEGARGE